MKKSPTLEFRQQGPPRNAKLTEPQRPQYLFLGNGLLMLLLAIGMFSDPFSQTRPLGSKVEDVQPICHPILFGGTYSAFENPTPRILRLLGNALDSLQDESTWGTPFLNSVPGTGQETDASPFWRFDKLPLLVQKAGNTAVSLFSGRITIQLSSLPTFSYKTAKKRRNPSWCPEF